MWPKSLEGLLGCQSGHFEVIRGCQASSGGVNLGEFRLLLGTFGGTSGELLDCTQNLKSVQFHRSGRGTFGKFGKVWESWVTPVLWKKSDSLPSTRKNYLQVQASRALEDGGRKSSTGSLGPPGEGVIHCIHLQRPS